MTVGDFDADGDLDIFVAGNFSQSTGATPNQLWRNNGDGTFSMGPQGPTDGWSMIGGAQLRGMPTFDAQSFTLEGSASVTEPVLYPRDGQ